MTSENHSIDIQICNGNIHEFQDICTQMVEDEVVSLIKKYSRNNSKNTLAKKMQNLSYKSASWS